jgi:hypothetical protein
MESFEEIIAEAVRIEYSEQDGKLYIVFEVISEHFKNKIKADWHKDIEFRLSDKKLIK